MTQHFIAILLLAALCAGWVAVQFLARRMQTKNHFDDLDGSTCGSCNCGGTGGSCRRASGSAA